MRIEAILFDKDGTLFDFEASWSGFLHDLISELSAGRAEVSARIAEVLHFDMSARRFGPESPVIAGTLAEVAAAIAPCLPGHASDGAPDGALLRRIDAAAARVRMAPVLPLGPFVRDLRARGLALGVATNASEAEAMAHLEAAGVGRAFDRVLGYDSGHGPKPGPGMCLAFAETVGIDPARVLMVGDSLHDLHAGRAAGMVTMAVLTGVADAETLRPHADALLPDIGHLADWLSASTVPVSRDG